MQPQPFNPSGKRAVGRSLRRTRTRVSETGRLLTPPGANPRRVSLEVEDIRPRPDQQKYDKSRAVAKFVASKERVKQSNAAKTEEAKFNEVRKFYLMPKPVEVQEYSVIITKLEEIFQSMLASPVDNLVLKARYAVYIAHVATNMATILSHNLKIYKQHDLDKVIRNFTKRKKGRVLPRKLKKMLNILGDIEVENTKDYFENMTTSVVNSYILSCLEELYKKFYELGRASALEANKFYGDSGIFSISFDIEEDFEFVKPGLMSLQFESFESSLIAVMRYHELLKTIEMKITPGFVVSTEKLMLYLNRNGMTFIDTVVLSNVKLLHPNMLVEQRVIVPVYCNVIGRDVRSLTNMDLLTHIECRLLDARK